MKTLPKDVFLKLLEPQIEYSRKRSTYKDCTKNMTSMITAKELISTRVLNYQYTSENARSDKITASQSLYIFWHSEQREVPAYISQHVKAQT